MYYNICRDGIRDICTNIVKLMQDEGFQTMRTLAKNMVWILKSIESGKKLG